ncbi:hypothetical protein D3C73_820570 [compost metagenome]
MVKVGEFQRIAQIEYRRVVTHQIPIAFLGIKLHGETTNVTLGVGGPALTGYGGEADEHVSLLADFREDFCAGVLANVVGDGESAVGAGTFGVHAALGDHFTVEMGQFFQKPHVL